MDDKDWTMTIGWTWMTIGTGEAKRKLHRAQKLDDSWKGRDKVQVYKLHRAQEA